MTNLWENGSQVLEAALIVHLDCVYAVVAIDVNHVFGELRAKLYSKCIRIVGMFIKVFLN